MYIYKYIHTTHYIKIKKDLRSVLNREHISYCRKGVYVRGIKGIMEIF